MRLCPFAFISSFILQEKSISQRNQILAQETLMLVQGSKCPIKLFLHIFFTGSDITTQRYYESISMFDTHRSQYSQ